MAVQLFLFIILLTLSAVWLKPVNISTSLQIEKNISTKPVNISTSSGPEMKMDQDLNVDINSTDSYLIRRCLDPYAPCHCTTSSSTRKVGDKIYHLSEHKCNDVRRKDRIPKGFECKQLKGWLHGGVEYNNGCELRCINKNCE